MLSTLYLGFDLIGGLLWYSLIPDILGFQRQDPVIKFFEILIPYLVILFNSSNLSRDAINISFQWILFHQQLCVFYGQFLHCRNQICYRYDLHIVSGHLLSCASIQLKATIILKTFCENTVQRLFIISTLLFLNICERKKIIFSIFNRISHNFVLWYK